jgi:hypothetical protein
LLLSFFVGVGGGGRVSLFKGLCWFIPGVAGGIPCDAWCSPVGLPNVFQEGSGPASGGAGALMFSQCNMAWRSFPQTRERFRFLKFAFSLLLYFLQVWPQCLNNIFDLRSSLCLLLLPSHYLGSSPIFSLV